MNERRSHDPVISDLAEKLDIHVKKAGLFWEAAHIRSGAMSDDIEDIKVALFAKDTNNKFGQVGLQVTAKNIDNHISVVCNLASLGWKIAVGALGFLTALKAAGML
tara:strand:- start:1584 stop:1901 length:318 start_codon:yes stop_codon:yes gene_type:complete